MQILKCSDLIEVPWKNGGGTTRNIAKGMLADHAVWTISRADVGQDGPFSDFCGMMRVLTVVSGGEMTLKSPTSSLAAKLWKPVRFDGALKIQSRLTGDPLTDLNLMFDPAQCDGDVVTRRGPFKLDVKRPAHGLLAFHVLSGKPTLNVARLTIGDTAFFTETDAALSLVEGDALLGIRLTYLDQSAAIKLCIADR